MVDDKRSIAWSCRRTLLTDPEFQSLKGAVQQPNHSSAQHSARSKAGAWTVCQDSLTWKGSVSKPEVNPANECEMLIQQDLRATAWCKATCPTLALLLSDSKTTDLSSIIPSRTQSWTVCENKGEQWEHTLNKTIAQRWDVQYNRSPLTMGPQDHNICHPTAFDARDHFLRERNTLRCSAA